ncbi:type II CRISPR RNA-guided endonuclease Cas9, partial [Methanocalculus natronophilus]|uniref:type II CRISPR RNA-guided endonuclease Cas9 n=1 Tax=Methanocalculus natronophilus TaxID=1262400 RepID=UPI0031B625FC
MVNNYVLGLDIGVTSVGWGIIDEKHEIVDAGVRLFEEADASDNETRREKRGSRRVKRRRKQRILEMKRLLKKEGLITDSFVHLQNPYALRVKGLKEKLTSDELATALLHIVKRRG